MSDNTIVGLFVQRPAALQSNRIEAIDRCATPLCLVCLAPWTVLTIAQSLPLS